MSRKYCSVPCSGPMFLFPKDPNLCERWKSECKIVRNVSNYMRVCCSHFLPDDIVSSGRCSRLKAGAVPKSNLPVSIKRKGRRSCIVHTCQKDESQGVTLHFFPKSAELRHSWATLCKVLSNVSRNTRICSNHFSDNDFICGVQGLKILKSGVLPCRNLPVSFPSLSACHKSKQWSVLNALQEGYEEETFDLISECSGYENEDAFVRRFVYEKL